MSVEAISWALNLAPVPADRNGQPSSACKFVLVGLANQAGPDGTSAFPSVRTLIRYTGLSERTVRSCLDRLEQGSVIRPCDPAVVAAKIKRADRRPQGWDLDLARIRTDFSDAEIDSLEHRFPGLRALMLSAQAAGAGMPLNGVYSRHPGGAVDDSHDEMHLAHPVAGPGCNERSNGVQQPASPGAAVAPEPSEEPSNEPSGAMGRDGHPAGGPTEPGGGAAEFFAALGEEWRLTASQRARLSPIVAAAVSSGWEPQALAEWTGANTTGVRNPYAVLATRLSPAQLPAPSPRRSDRLPWCGGCDERTRLLDFRGDSPRPCPRCRPPSCVVTPGRERGIGEDFRRSLPYACAAQRPAREREPGWPPRFSLSEVLRPSDWPRSSPLAEVSSAAIAEDVVGLPRRTLTRDRRRDGVEGLATPHSFASEIDQRENVCRVQLQHAIVVKE